MNVVGLFISTVAAVLMYYFPPRGVLYSETGEPVVTWVGDPTEEGMAKGRWQARISRLSPCLLALGFSLQLLAALLA